jgi:hypothetical protein
LDLLLLLLLQEVVAGLAKPNAVWSVGAQPPRGTPLAHAASAQGSLTDKRCHRCICSHQHLNRHLLCGIAAHHKRFHGAWLLLLQLGGSHRLLHAARVPQARQSEF